MKHFLGEQAFMVCHWLIKTRPVNNAHRNKCPYMQNQDKPICADPTAMWKYIRSYHWEERTTTFRSFWKIPVNWCSFKVNTCLNWRRPKTWRKANVLFVIFCSLSWRMRCVVLEECQLLHFGKLLRVPFETQRQFMNWVSNNLKEF